MYLEEIVLDGFKSYAQCTTIKALDPEFTAITGLNGSGKSNILDGICFVLGITSLQRIRVTTLTDLIYKQGQAGVTKATVSLIFNNENVAAAPEGFESSPKINITRTIFENGTSKYLINNEAAKAKTLRQLFESVNMNINNPNFLIMQGRIQAILTMKPPQLLSLLEETAGTSLYEQNRKEAVKTFDEKQAKLAEIEKIIGEDITPKIEKLEKERKIGVEIAYVQKAIAVLEIIEEFAAILDCEKREDDYEKDLEGAKAKDAALKKTLQDLDNQFIQMNAELAEMQGTANQQQTDLIQRSIDELEGQIAVQQQKIDLEQEKLSVNQSAIEKKEQQIAELQAQIKQAEARARTLEGSETSVQMQRLTAELEQKKCDLGAISAELALARTGEVDADFLAQFVNSENKTELDRLKQVLFGENDFISLNEITNRLESEQIMNEAELRDLVAEHEESAGTLLSLENERINAESEDMAQEAEISRQQQRIQAQIQLFVKKYPITAPQLASIDELKQFSADLRQRMDDQRRAVNSAKQAAEESQRSKQAKISQAREQFMDTLIRTFRSSSQIVSMAQGLAGNARIGMVGTVLDACDINQDLLESLNIDEIKLLKAIEIAAGQKLFNVIFNTEEEAASFVTSPQCTERITCLPIETIRGRELQDAEIEILRQNNGFLLLDFLRPKSPDLLQIFQFLFGATAIVATTREAKNVAYDKRCALKCVTLEGDVVDPSGVVTGGSRHSGSSESFLRCYLDFLTAGAESEPGTDETLAVADEMRQMTDLYSQFQYNIAHYMGDLQEFTAASRGGRIAREVAELQRRQDVNLASQQKIQRYLQIISAIAQQIAPHAAQHTHREIAEIEADQRAAQAELNELEKLISAAEDKGSAQETEALRLRIQGCSQDVLAAQAEIDSLRQQKETFAAALQNEHNKASELLQRLENAQTQRGEIINENDRQNSEKQRLQRSVRDLEQRIGRERDAFTRHLEVIRDAQAQLQALSKELLAHGTNVAEFAAVFCELFGASAAFHTQGTRRTQLSSELYFQQLVDARLVQNASDAREFTRNAVEKRVAGSLLTERQKALQDLLAAQEGFSGTSENLEELQKSARQLIQMQQRLARDREKIIAVIARVDEKKDQAVAEVYTNVNASLAQIFSTLLPGANAALQRVSDGVQFAVQLGSTKTTLSGLSGGQKSLLALSFTLALLKFKPSPIYILDEIDAALDLSHTHNIGKIIQEQFGGSQFIIVSLKEGMFNHANKLIKVRFSEGMSKLESSK